MATAIQVISFPFEASGIPESFVFPRKRRIVSLGYSESDICLKDWDPLGLSKKKGRLYSPHIQFHYIPAPVSQWHILSLRGFRRGNKSVHVNGNHIFSGHGLVPLSNHSKFSVGNFQFEFCADLATDLEDFENPAYLVSILETDLRLLVDKLSIKLPNSVYMADEMMIDWDRVYFSQLLNWVLKDPRVEEYIITEFESVSNAKRCASFLIDARNVIFHPVKGTLSASEIQELSEIYVRLRMVANKLLKRTTI